MFTAGGNGSSATEPGVATRLADPKALDRVVEALRELQRRGGIERTLAIGELILQQFFGGNAAAWHDRRRNKNNSVRRLATRKDCPFSRSALNEAVAVHVASLTLPCVRTFGHIGASHVVAVLGLPHEGREPLLLRAERDRMSVRELRQQVVSLRRAEGERRGRPAIDACARALSRFRRAVGDVTGVIGELQAQSEFDSAVRAEIRSLMGELNRALDDATCMMRDVPSVVRSWPIPDAREQSA